MNIPSLTVTDVWIQVPFLSRILLHTRWLCLTQMLLARVLVMELAKVWYQEVQHLITING